jgi:magnesium transporter
MDSDLLVSSRFMEAHPVDAARLLERLPTEETAAFLQQVTPPLAAAVMVPMNTMTSAECLASMVPKHAASILGNIPLDMAALLLRRSEARFREVILDGMPSEKAQPLRSLLDYPEGTAGSLMDPRVFTLFEDDLARGALKLLRKRPEHMIYYVYVLDREHRYRGYTTLREWMLADPGASISSVMQTDMGHLSPRLRRAAILRNPDWRRFHALPVVSEKGVFLGALGYQTLRLLEQEETRGGGLESEQEAGTALAELYRIGIVGLMKWVTSTADAPAKGGK